MSVGLLLEIFLETGMNQRRDKRFKILLFQGCIQRRFNLESELVKE